jgi:hypothetical protein
MAYKVIGARYIILYPGQREQWGNPEQQQACGENFSRFKDVLGLKID